MRALLALAVALVFEVPAAAALDFSSEEVAKILQHGPWPPQLAPDPGNRVSGNPAAIALGEKLFFEPRLSGSGSLLCATCHAPFRYFQDARARAFGLELLDRNTPTLVNARFYRRYGWDGAQASLWAQSLRPLLDAREMSASAAHVAKTVRALFRGDYQAAFGGRSETDEEILVNAGKALAAYQETLVSARTAFDDFRDTLEKGGATTAYPMAARRGLKIFVGKGSCSACHSGPQFTNASRLNLSGRSVDDASNFGALRVPGLRAVAQTAPYMHDGSRATLRDAVKFHSALDQTEISDLVAFLESLSEAGMSPPGDE